MVPKIGGRVPIIVITIKVIIINSIIIIQSCGSVGFLHLRKLKPHFLAHFLSRGSPGLSVSGPSYDADGGWGPHVHHHLLWLRGLPARKHLSAAGRKSAVPSYASAQRHTSDELWFFFHVFLQ